MRIIQAAQSSGPAESVERPGKTRQAPPRSQEAAVSSSVPGPLEEAGTCSRNTTSPLVSTRRQGMQRRGVGGIWD